MPFSSVARPSLLGRAFYRGKARVVTSNSPPSLASTIAGAMPDTFSLLRHGSDQEPCPIERKLISKSELNQDRLLAIINLLIMRIED